MAELRTAARQLALMFGMEEDICEQVLRENEGDVDKAVDHMLTINSDLNLNGSGSGSSPPPRKPLTRQEAARRESNVDVIAAIKNAERVRAVNEFLEQQRREAAEAAQQERLRQIEVKRKRVMEIEEQKRVQEEERIRKMEELKKVSEEKRRRRESEERQKLLDLQMKDDTRWLKEQEKHAAEMLEREKLIKEAEERRKAEEVELDGLRQERARLAAETARVKAEIEKARKEEDERQALEDAKRKAREQKPVVEDSFPSDVSTEEELQRLQAEAKAFLHMSLRLAPTARVAVPPLPSAPPPDSPVSVEPPVDAVVETPAATIEPPVAVVEEPSPKVVEEGGSTTESVDGTITQGPSISVPRVEDRLKQMEKPSLIYDLIPELPLFSIYYNSKDDSSDTAPVRNTIKKFLSTIPVAPKDIKEVDLATDYELGGFIKAQGNGVPLVYPVVFLRATFVGNLEALVAWRASGKLTRQINGDMSDSENGDSGSDLPSGPVPVSSDASAPSLGVLDKALEGMETMASYLNPLSWLPWSTTKSPSTDDSMEFDVIHTNWYWRKLRRKFRFTETVILRIHAKHGDVRAAHPYSEVASLKRPNPYNLVISYSTSSSPDYIKASTPDIDAMISILLEKNPALKVEDFSDSQKM
eukprot:TRINITY_DN2007_c0_g1_i1.p1 TRINITY_DN2007_c0_g1~~TRINITY_DN2007_c0_g1_i1.p1  ORF type:complete len:664 (+),score=204.17 TRINITY_DN2007_c0_g1_i1:65-1993(+)